MTTDYDSVYDEDDADEVVVIRMTRRQWWHLDDLRAEYSDRYPKRYAERQAALEAIDKAKSEGAKRLRVQKTWYGWKAWDAHSFAFSYARARSRERVIEKAKRKFYPPPKWEEVEV